MKESYFDGGLLGLIGVNILAFLITAFTFGICFPWAAVILMRWRVQHTVIDGNRLTFDGTAMQLFGNWIKWLLLMIVTLGIYGLWVGIALQKWEVKHTHNA